VKNLEIFCICLNNDLLNIVKNLNYSPVGLGTDEFSPEWIRDNSQNNISYKNKYYGEHTFHYWFWKNRLNSEVDGKWIGFCGYRRLWSSKNNDQDKNLDIKKNLLQTAPKIWDDYDVILGDKIHLHYLRWSKVIKYGKIAFLRNPKSIFKKGRNIRFHFDMFHGNGLLDKAINLLEKKDREDFREYTRINTSYNQGNMFICKSKELMKNYYETVFPWLERCEKTFGFDLKSYGNIRIYGFLTERFLPYWFNKYSKTLEWPIIFYDLNKLK